jgi:DNA-binding response OmpR family regulator
LERVWGNDWFGDDHVVDVHLANLRRKIGEPATAPRNIKTVRGIGYRFDP